MYNFDAVKTRDAVIKFIRDWFAANAPADAFAIIGISGGKDSSILAALAARALGPNRVIGVMMPDGVQADIADSRRVIAALKIHPLTLNINKATFDLTALITSSGLTSTPQMLQNMPPRVRMTTLYAVAQSADADGCPINGRVINTCNFSETWIGWETRFGDSVGDVAPFATLTASEVIQIGDTLPEIPADLIHKKPSDGLCGKTDEDKFGFTYAELDEVIRFGTTANKEHLEKINKMHKNSAFKRNPIVYYDSALPIANTEFLGKNFN